MYTKNRVDKIENDFYINYKTAIYDPVGLIHNLLNNEVSITKIWVKQDADVGFKTFGGYYTPETFLVNFNNFDKSEIENIILYLNDGNSISIRNNGITLISKDNIELSSYIKSNIQKL